MHLTSKRILLPIALMSALLLTSCATNSSSCPQIKNYSENEQLQAASELNILGDKSVLSEFMIDYYVLREQVKVCQ